jgi:PHD-finger
MKDVFSSLGKAAPPSKFEAEIHKNIEAAEEARKNEEERVQIDESVEKKDLVAGSMATSIKLPPLRGAPPDQPSCVPCKEVRMKPIDAFFCSWLDCCFTCGTSGAADTMLMCVDCGEAFHSFCINAPIHSMELSSVARWRCPNCKICEISGDVPQDETRMLFCEMCDRAFSIELLDPPLKVTPSGLWICGQCVDCKLCRNMFDSQGSSLRYWSRDPEKCFRCGGCHGLIDEVHESRRCSICSLLIRADDSDVLDCCSCQQLVHAQCDHRANEYLKANEEASGTQQRVSLRICEIV